MLEWLKREWRTSNEQAAAEQVQQRRAQAWAYEAEDPGGHQARLDALNARDRGEQFHLRRLGWRHGWRWQLFEIGSDGICRALGRCTFRRRIAGLRVAQELLRVSRGARWELMGEIDAHADLWTDPAAGDVEAFLESARAELDIGAGMPESAPRQVVIWPGWTFVTMLKPSEVLVAAPGWPPAIADLETLAMRRIEP